MKCPVCGAAELIHGTRDLPYTYKGEATVIPAVTADFCPACDESITDMAETERVMREMQAFNKQVDAATHARLAPVADELRFFFITSRLDLTPGAGATKVDARASGHGKCVRCWHYRADVGANAADPQLCGRCVVNVNGAGESRRWF